jgi:hypothetical protein
MATISNDIGNAESEGGMDLDEIFLLFGIVIAIAVGLAIWLYQGQVGQIGVGLIGAFTSPVSAGFNGIANAISAFFNWLARSLGNLLYLPGSERVLAWFMSLKLRIMSLKLI